MDEERRASREKNKEYTERYNSIAAQWNKNVYFMMKNETSYEETILCFLNLLMKQLKNTLNKKQLEIRTVIL